LALGVGANTAIFSVVNGVLLRPLPFPEPERIISVLTDWRGPEPVVGSLSYPDLIDLETESPAIESLAGWANASMTLTGHGDPIVVPVTRVTKGLLEIFGVAPVVGRDIRAEEFGPVGPTVVVIGHGFWHARFGGRADVLGEELQLSSVSYEIVGVAPPGFAFPESAELWIPRRVNVEDCGRGCHTMRGVGRLAQGATPQSAATEAETLAANLRGAYPDTNTDKAFRVESLKDNLVGDVRTGLLLLLGAVGLVVLIACANVANLLLVRASTKTGEMAIRTAIGASRARLVGHSLIESSLLAAGGGVLGIGLAALAMRVLALVGTGIPRTESVALDGRVLAFTAASVIVVTLLFGLAPAFALGRSSVHAGLGSRGAGESGDKGRFRRLLLAAEVCLSAILLVGAGLLLRSFVELYRVELGFETRNITRFSLVLPEARYESLDEIRRFYRDLEKRIAVLPEVESVGSVWGAPLGNSNATGTILVVGRPEPPPEVEIEGSIHSVGPGWMETMRVPLVQGRGLSPYDEKGPPTVALVNEAFVKTIFPDEDPVGQRFRVTVDLGYGSPEWTLVGVIGNLRSRALDTEPVPEIYVPHGVYGPGNMTVTVRGRAGAGSPLPAIRTILAEKDSEVPMYRVETLEEAVARHVAPTRFYLLLIAVFAVLAAVLAAVGLYGVVAYNACRRTREIGLRVALGAPRGSILGMVVREGVVPAIVGLALGLAIAYGGGRIAEAILFGVSPRDPWTFAATGLLLVVVSLVAALVPATRASRVDPAHALRVD
jgi:predicted permease